MCEMASEHASSPLSIAHRLGAYLFYAQHDFPAVHVEPRERWSYTRAALMSSSYMAMGPVMRWFTGNIGYHHVHHLNPSTHSTGCQQRWRPFQRFKARARLASDGVTSSRAFASRSGIPSPAEWSGARTRSEAPNEAERFPAEFIAIA
jgi:fatty acid desaturase